MEFQFSTDLLHPITVIVDGETNVKSFPSTVLIMFNRLYNLKHYPMVRTLFIFDRSYRSRTGMDLHGASPRAGRYRFLNPPRKMRF